MTFYKKELKRLKNTIYANNHQLSIVIRTRAFINNNLEKNLDLEVLARNCFVSKFHLIRLFKKYYGQTPGRFIRTKRIEVAQVLLAKGQPVTETCYAVGFRNPSSFSTLFKKKTSLAPSEFQKKQFSQSLLNEVSPSSPPRIQKSIK